MHTTGQLLDRAKRAQAIQSDYKLAKALGVTANAVTNWRQGRAHPDDATAVRLADMMNRDAGSVMAELHFERAKIPAVKAAWKALARTLLRKEMAS